LAKGILGFQDDAFVLMSAHYDLNWLLEPDMARIRPVLEGRLGSEPFPVDAAFGIARSHSEITDVEDVQVLEEMGPLRG
jgi:hypothetical protein